MLDAAIRGKGGLGFSRQAGPTGAAAAVRRPVVIFALVVALLANLAVPANLKKPKEFSEGIKAFDREDWTQGAELMNKAASQQQDDGAVTRIYGTRFEPYLPFYFWGLALYKQGKCPEALAQWERCLQIKAVNGTDKLDSLLRYRDDCRKQAAAGLSPLRETPAGPGNQLLHVQSLQTDRP